MVTHLIGPWVSYECKLLGGLQNETNDQTVSARSLLPPSVPMIPLRPFCEQEQRAVVVDFTWSLLPSFTLGNLSLPRHLLVFYDGRVDEGEEERSEDPFAEVDEVLEYFPDDAWRRSLLKLLRFRHPIAAPALCGPLRRLVRSPETPKFLATRFPGACCVGEYTASAMRELVTLGIPVLFLSYPLFLWQASATHVVTQIDLDRRRAVLARQRERLLRHQVWWDLRAILTEETFSH